MQKKTTPSRKKKKIGAKQVFGVGTIAFGGMCRDRWSVWTLIDRLRTGVERCNSQQQAQSFVFLGKNQNLIVNRIIPLEVVYIICTREINTSLLMTQTSQVFKQKLSCITQHLKQKDTILKMIDPT